MVTRIKNENGSFWGNKKERKKYIGIKEKENTWMLTLQSLKALSRVATNY